MKQKSINSNKRGGNNQSTISTIRYNVMQIILIILAFIWMLAVIKVFLLEGNHKLNYHENDNTNIKEFSTSTTHNDNLDIVKDKETITKKFISHINENNAKLSERAMKLVVPTLSEWAFIRNSPNYKIPENRVNLVAEKIYVASVESKIQDEIISNFVVKKASELVWPPVQPDGSIPATDGIEIMPLIGLKVPRFWEAPAGNTALCTVYVSYVYYVYVHLW